MGVPLCIGRELLLTVECKAYSNASSLKGEVLKNLGMVQDWSKTVHPSKTSNNPQGCLHCGLEFLPTFVTNVRSGQRRDIERYLDAYDLHPKFGGVPGSRGERRFRAFLDAELTARL